MEEFQIKRPEQSFALITINQSAPAFDWMGSVTIFLLTAFGLLFLLGSCSPKTSPNTLPLETTTRFSETGARALPDRWWTEFNDPALNALVDTALAANFNLRTTWERLRAARAVVDRESSALLPSLDAGLQGAISFPQPDFVGGENLRLGLNAGYEVDLWGRINATVDAQRFRAQASLTDYQAAAISLSAEITRTWYQLLEARNQVTLVEEQIETNRQILDLLRNRFGGGQVRSVDILRQEQLLAATREQLTVAESRAEVLEHQLAVLLGRPAQAEPDYPPAALPAPPPLPETGLPVELVRRRPDLQSAFHRLQAADRELAAAISSQYPRLSFSGNASLRSNNFQNLLRDWAYSFGGNLFAPIFFAGELRAEVDRTESVKNQRLYEYGQAVLIAFREVEDALIREQKQRERITALQEQVDLAQQSYEQLRIAYLNGAGNYLDTLTALTQEQQLQRDLLAANLTLLEFRIALYRALAGGFGTERTS